MLIIFLLFSICHHIIAPETPYIKPNGNKLFYMNPGTNRVWADCPWACTIMCDLYDVASRTPNSIVLKPDINYHDSLMVCLLDGNKDWTKHYLLLAFDFQVDISPAIKKLSFYKEYTFSCIFSPNDRRVSYASGTIKQPGRLIDIIMLSQISFKITANESHAFMKFTVECNCREYRLFKSREYEYAENIIFVSVKQYYYLIYIREMVVDPYFYAPLIKYRFNTYCYVSSIREPFPFEAPSPITLLRRFRGGIYKFNCYIPKTSYEHSSFKIYILSIMPLTMTPDVFLLNYTYENNIITTIEITYRQELQPELSTVGINISADSYDTSNGWLVIRALARLDQNVYCFMGKINACNITKCYKLMGFFTVKIEPNLDIISLSIPTAITCFKFHIETKYDAVTIDPININTNYYVRLANKSIIFKAEMDLHCKHMCVKCEHISATAERCYKFIVTMRLHCNPEQEFFNVYFDTPILHFYFTSSISLDQHGATCKIISGAVWSTATNDFQLLGNVPVGRYIFNCSMTHYNYADTYPINVLSNIEYANIYPLSGSISYMDESTVICNCTKAYFFKHLTLYVLPKDKRKVKRIKPTEITINKDIWLRNTTILFFCNGYTRLLDNRSYDLLVDVAFTHSPQREVYYILDGGYKVFARFYNILNRRNLSTTCICHTCPESIQQVGLFIEILKTAPAGVFTFECTYVIMNFTELLLITTSRENIHLQILPSTDIIYTSVNHDIVCQYNRNLKIVDAYINFDVTYYDPNAYSRVSRVRFHLKSNITYHKKLICFGCNFDTVSFITRCYTWLGFFKLIRVPQKEIYFHYHEHGFEVFFVNLNDTVIHYPVRCITAVGPDDVIQNTDHNRILITTMLTGLYMINCKMFAFDEFEIFNTSIQSPGRSLFKSNFHPQLYNASGTLLIQNEVMTFTLLYANLFPNATYKWSAYTDTSYLTPTHARRSARNSALKMDGNVLTILDIRGEYGYDYMIYCNFVFTVANITVPVNYTIGRVPSEIILNTSFYVMFLERINFTSDGFPPEFLYFTVHIIKGDIFAGTNLDNCKMPEMFYFGHNVLTIISSLRMNASATYDYWVKKHISVRVFKVFKWKQFKSDIAYVNTEINCETYLLTAYTLSIVQFNGPSVIPEIHSHALTVPDVYPGKYQLACILTANTITTPFIRLMWIHIFSESNEICYLPFGPVNGMLIKCISHQFPTIGTYKMSLIELDSNTTVKMRRSSLLRIPYIIPINKKYEILCQFFVGVKEYRISRTFRLKGVFIVPVVIQIKCHISESIPQEYNFGNDENGYFMYSKLFYLANLYNDFQYVGLYVLLLAFLSGLYVIPSQMMLRKKYILRYLQDLHIQNQYLISRLVVRKLEYLEYENHKVIASGYNEEDYWYLKDRDIEKSPMY